MIIPEDLTEFLEWVKYRTEKRWSHGPQTAEESYGCDKHDSFWGAKWVKGLSEDNIINCENKWNIKFPSDYKKFLKILHAVNKPMVYEIEDDEVGEITQDIKPLFYNWRTDENEISEKFTWPYRTILEDVLGANKVWLKSWGTRPQNDSECELIFSDWYSNAPKLVPINAHRFLIAEPAKDGNPILSVWGSDTILYGWNIRHYLLNELRWDLGLSTVQIYSDNTYDEEPIPEYKKIYENEMKLGQNIEIPYWGEMILYWSSGWASIGRKYPYPSDGPHPIVKADADVFQQKTFQHFD